LQVTVDHPEIFNRSEDISQTDKVYALALESLREKPHLFVLGYVKGIAKYFDALFRYATDFKPLRLGLLLIPWICGVWHTLKRWRELPYSLLLAIEAGIIVSSPFLIYDAHNRAFASTIAVDALFVALGLVWICKRLGTLAVENKRCDLRPANASGLAAIGLIALALPVAMFAAIRPTSAPVSLKTPECEIGQKAVALKLSQGTLLLPLVAAGREQLYPLAVRADHFGERFHRWVHAKQELAVKPGTTLVWGLRMEAGARAALSYFSWKGPLPANSDSLHFCVKLPSAGHRIGTGSLAQLH